MFIVRMFIVEVLKLCSLLKFLTCVLYRSAPVPHHVRLWVPPVRHAQAIRLSLHHQTLFTLPLRQVALLPFRQAALLPLRQVALLSLRQVALHPLRQVALLPLRNVALFPLRQVALLLPRQVVLIPLKIGRSPLAQTGNPPFFFSER
jgi:hypothetical protein